MSGETRIVSDPSELVELEREVIAAAFWWYAEINRARSTSAIHVALEDFEQGLFTAISNLLDARYYLNCEHATDAEVR